MIKKDDTCHDKWMAQLIVAQAEAWNTLWKQLWSTKQIRKMANNNVWWVLQTKAVHRPLSMVVAPGNIARSRQENHQKVKLEQACLAKASHWFTWAQHTPLLTTPLIELFGESGKSKEFTKILAGNFIPPPHWNIYVAKFLTLVSQPPGIEDVALRSTQTYCHGWQRARGVKGSSTLGIHFGNYMARSFNPEILVVNVTLVNIPLCTGFTYDWWKKAVNVMIEISMWKNSVLSCCSKQILMLITGGLAEWWCTKPKEHTYWPMNNTAKVWVGNPSVSQQTFFIWHCML